MTEEIKQEEIKEPIQEEVKPTPDEERASSFGWKPKEKWVEEGHPEDDWVPAKHFNKFGDLKNKVVEKDKQLTKQDKIIKMMKNHHTTVRETAYQEALKLVKQEREAALSEENLVKAEQARDRMDALRENYIKHGALPADIEQEIKQVEQEVKQPSNQTPPEFHDFQARNPWYTVGGEDEMSQEADKIGFAEIQAAKAKGKHLTADDVYKTVEIKIRKLFPEKFEKAKGPQHENGNRAAAGNSNTKTKLSDEELAVAKAFGLSPEKYAEEQGKYRGR